MRALILIYALFIISCTKENDHKCKNYTIITESSQKEAMIACRGLANNHPTFEVIKIQQLGCLTDELSFMAKNHEKTQVFQACTGINYIVRTTVIVN